MMKIFIIINYLQLIFLCYHCIYNPKVGLMNLETIHFVYIGFICYILNKDITVYKEDRI
jgi:hypothetical protein